MSRESQENRSDTPPRPSRAESVEQVGVLTRLSDGREYSLGYGSLRVGRQRRADLIISDRTVSRHHADVCYESGRYVLYDHSTNGTWVNGNLVAVAQPLRDRDAVKFGAVEFRFMLKPLSREGSGPRSADISGRVSERATAVMKGGKRPQRGGRLGRLLIALVALLVAVAVFVYFLFPEIIDDILSTFGG